MNMMELLRNHSVFWSKLGFCYDPPRLGNRIIPKLLLANALQSNICYGLLDELVVLYPPQLHIKLYVVYSIIIIVQSGMFAHRSYPLSGIHQPLAVTGAK